MVERTWWAELLRDAARKQRDGEPFISDLGLPSVLDFMRVPSLGDGTACIQGSFSLVTLLFSGRFLKDRPTWSVLPKPSKPFPNPVALTVKIKDCIQHDHTSHTTCFSLLCCFFFNLPLHYDHSHI